MSFCKVLEVREEYELTQQELANIIGGSRVNISNWETEKEIPNIQRINKIADHFQVSLDYLFNLSNKKVYAENTPGELKKDKAGKRLKIVREENHLSLRQLAKILNTSSSTISAYENGKTLILTAFAIHICKRYKVSMDWLYGKKDYR